MALTGVVTLCTLMKINIFRVILIYPCKTRPGILDLPGTGLVINVELFVKQVLSRTEEPAKPGICARDRRALHQLALNVHVKHSDLT